VTDYAALLRELAVPRLVGTPGHTKVREALKRELTARGFVVEEHAFVGRPSRMLFGSRRVVEGVNLIATRPSGRPAVRPSVWLVAHYDSKGQPISMALRLAAVVALAAGSFGLLLDPMLAAGLLVASLIVLSQNRVTNNSPGAVDNASALIAVLMTLDTLQAKGDVGVIFPDAEEFGLLGARALAVDRAVLLAGAAVVNLDGLDDPGRPLAFFHREGPRGQAVAQELGARSARWWPVVVDGIALGGAAGECVSILKGNWRTALIVHTPRDDAARLTLSGARQVADGLARALTAA
jgi:hypothetical protein